MRAMMVDEHVYSAYGDRGAATHGARSAYAGEILEEGAYGYMLGERPYAPTLRRFLKPDALSPFASGGINRYAYCGGDPIGRIDPGGNSWFAWLASTLDRIELPVTTVRSAAGVESAFVTPTLRATAVSRPESAGLWSAIRRKAPTDELMGELRTYGNARVPVSGSGSQQTRLFSAAPGIPGIQWPRIGTTAGATVFLPDKRMIQIVTGPLAFSHDPKRAKHAARGVTYPHWVERTNRSGGVHFAATTSVNLSYMRTLKNYIDNKYPGRPVTLFAGAHGRQASPFWDADGKRMHVEQKFFDLAEKKVRKLQWPVTLVNYADVSSRHIRTRMEFGKGVDIHYSCFGATDLIFMQAFNIFDITSRALKPVDLPGDDPTP